MLQWGTKEKNNEQKEYIVLKYNLRFLSSSACPEHCSLMTAAAIKKPALLSNQPLFMERLKSSLTDSMFLLREEFKFKFAFMKKGGFRVRNGSLSLQSNLGF